MKQKFNWVEYNSINIKTIKLHKNITLKLQIVVINFMKQNMKQVISIIKI